MEAKRYLDFDLRISRSNDGYRAEIFGSPAGRAMQAFQLPFDEHELENYLLKIGQRRAGMRKADSPENRAATDFGRRLFETVFQGEMEHVFRNSLDSANAAENGGLRIRLHLGDVPELADLPWEYLYVPQRRQFLALSRATPIVRYFDLPETVKPLAVKPPLRVLVMLSNPSDVDCLDVEKEWQKLKIAVQELEAKKRLILERLERATLTDLLHRLRKSEYHVFHFVGHGSFDSNSQEGVLAVEDENGRKQLVSGSDFCNFLGDERAFRLVLLNACEGARASRTDPFSGVAQSLVLRGIPAVIAMQFEVSDEAAVAMASGFYSALADDYPVDAALSEARKAVLAAGCSVEWGTPVLYLRSPDGRIFDVDTTAAQPITPPIEQKTESVTPAPLPTEPLVRPQPEPVVRPEPAKMVTHAEKRGARPWLWVLVGMGLVFAALIVLGVFRSTKEKGAKAGSTEMVDAKPAIAAQPTASFTPPLVPSKLGSSAANMPADLSNSLNASSANELNPTQSNANSNAWQAGIFAGSDFVPTSGRWRLSIPQLSIVNDMQFAPNGTFLASVPNATSMQGRWTYTAATSTLWLQYQNGYVISVPLWKNDENFSAWYKDETGQRRDVYLEREIAVAPNKFKK